MEKYLIAGLGNIGEEYANTRHNAGFLIADALAYALKKEKEDEKISSSKLFTPERYSFLNISKFRGRSLFIIKPTTYMNLSGKAISYWLQQEKIPVKNLLVIA